MGDLLSQTGRAIGNNLPTFAVVAFIFSVPGIVVTTIGTKRWTDRVWSIVPDLQNAGQLGQPNPADLFAQMFDLPALLLIVAGLILTLVLYFLGQGTLMFATVESVAGRRVSPGHAMATGFRAAPSLLVIAIVLTMFYFVAMLPGIVLWSLIVGGAAAASGEAGPMIALCCGCPAAVLMIFAPIYYVFVLFLLTVPAAVVEKCGPVQAMQRSMELTKGYRATLFLGSLVLVLVIIVVAVLGAIATIPLGGGMDFATGRAEAPSMLAVVISTIVQIGQSAVWISLVSAFAGVAYARIRGTREGVDAASIASVFS